MRNTLLIAFLIVSCSTSYGQRKWFSGPTALYVEGAGPGGFGSISSEHMRSEKKFDKWEYSFLQGLSTYPGDKNTGWGFVLVHNYLWRYGEKTIKPEIGFGHTATITTKLAVWARIHLRTGIHIQKPGKRLFCRISYTPYISYFPPAHFQFENWGAIGIGYFFRTRE